MAKNLPGLVIRIGAETKNAIDGLNKVNRAVGQSATGAERFRASWRKVGPAVGAATAAVGALAVKLGVDAVQAAKEEEVSVGRLSQTLKNLGLAAADAGVEKFIDDMQFATGIADNDLRPAMDRLVRSTGNVGEAQYALGIAADIAVAKQRNVTDVANILGKAYDGNTMALGRLGVGLDKTVLKSGDMGKITEELSRLFSGQAAAAADTLAGRTAILKIAFDELLESFGKGLISGLAGDMNNAGKSSEDMAKTLRDMQPTLEQVGSAITGFAALALNAFSVVRGYVITNVYGIMQAMNGMYDAYINIADKLNIISDEEADRERASQRAIEAAQLQTYYEDLLGYQFGQTGDAAQSASSDIDWYSRRLAAQETQTNKSRTALQRLQAQMDKMSKNRSIASQFIGLAESREQGPGKNASGRDLRKFGLNYADQAEQLARDIAERGNFSERSKARARRVLANARDYLGGLGLGSNFTDRQGAYLGTPAALRAGTTNTRAVGSVTDESRKMGTTVRIDTVNVYADTVAEAVQKAKEAARLAALSGTRYQGMADTGRGYRRPNPVAPRPAPTFGPSTNPF